ncbi:uncharacterized protein LOC124151576 [Haliotis rufescens]|uniref:uncharacterized protein LOC124151576 n=1 Tax=Haliotis rufescens TaxID=6454 RepID=UPI00201ECF69|nr:uncharacterized protein LOC124151576 [Haliotis rufescens]
MVLQNIIFLLLISIVTPDELPFDLPSLKLATETLKSQVMDLQVPKTKHFFPPFRWDEEQGMWPSDVKLNFHGYPDYVLFRELFGIFDNNMFTTTYVMACLVEGRRYINSTSYGPTHEEMTNGLNAIKSHHDMNVNYSNSLMTFWPQKYNETLGVYNSYPINLNDLIKTTDAMPLNATYEFLEKLGLKDVEGIIKALMSIRGGYTYAFHIPPDFDDTFLNIGLGSLLSEMSHLYPTYDKMWRSHNTNLTSVFDALKYYAYRPFSGNQRVNTIDSRTYYYLRHWLEQEKQAGHDVALVPTWIQDTDEVRTWFDKGVMMPYNINNIDVTVCANFIFGVTNGIINGLFQPSLLDDPEIMQIYNDTSRMIAFQVQTNFSDRADLALTYYPSVIEFYWFVARTYNKLQETLDRTGSLPHKGMDQVLADFKRVLRTYASPRLVTQGKKGSQAGYDLIYYDDFLGNADKSYENQTVNNAEDRIFTTSMALNALMTTWTTQDQHTEKVIWDKDTPANVKTTVDRIVSWLYYFGMFSGFEPWNAFFSGSYKGHTTEPYFYPMNRIELFNGTRINDTFRAHGHAIMGVEDVIPEEEYEQKMKHIWGHYHTPTVFPGYNDNAVFFPFWSSDAYTYVIQMLGVAKYARTMD